MKRSFQGFRSVVEHCPDAIIVINLQNEILYGSASNANVLGYEPQELLGRNCLESVHPEDRADASRALESAVTDSKGPVKWSSRVRHRNGNYSWMENTVSNLLIDLEVQGMIMHQRDIDARRAAELESERHAQELARSNADLEEFAYTAAHDLREPLRAIGAYTEMLLRRTPMDSNSKQMAGFITDAVTRMTTLISDLMSYTITGVPASGESIDLNDAVAQATQNLKLQIEESGATISVEALPRVRSNEIQLVRVFQNLISNAVKYRSVDPVRIDISAERDGSKWVVKVKDNGIGISPDDQVSIFTAFKRLAKVDVPGSGLGLAVCKEIVEGLGGAISVQSQFGSGSTFMFTVEDTGGMAPSTAA